MKALITGGAGFAGSHLTENLLARGYEVTVLALAQEDTAHLVTLTHPVRIERVDLREAAELKAILERLRPDQVYHLAALTSPTESLRDPTETYAVNFGGTLNLLQACRGLGDACRILVVSSSEVYGHGEGQALPLREDMPLRPANPYAGSKAAAEMLAYQFFRSYGLRVVRVRPFNHTGPRQSSTFVCSDFARQIAEISLGLRLPVMTVGNIAVKRDFSDVRDIVQGYNLLLDKGQAGEVYQLGSGCAVPVEQVLKILLRFCPRSVEVRPEPSRLRASEAAAIWGDTSKAERAVGWSRQYSLEATLRDLMDYWITKLKSQASVERKDSP